MFGEFDFFLLIFPDSVFLKFRIIGNNWNLFLFSCFEEKKKEKSKQMKQKK